MNSIIDYTKEKIDTNFLFGTTNATVYIVRTVDGLTASGAKTIDMPSENLWEDRLELRGMMKLTEMVLNKDWNTPQEDQAWAHL